MLAVVAPVPVGIAAGLFVLLLASSGLVSLGSILAAWTIPASVLLLPSAIQAERPPALIVLVFALAAFITVTHRANIVRLLRGTEPAFPKLQIWRRFSRRSQ